MSQGGITLFVCGGTGGHVFPALAIADSMRQLTPDEIRFAGRAASLEEKLVAAKWPFESIEAVPLHRSNMVQNLRLPFKLARAFWKAYKLIKHLKPQMVVATGGYVSLPVIVVAGLKKIPVFIQEQNAVAGVANKIGARFAKRIYVTSAQAANAFPTGKTVILGNPVRKLPEVSTLKRPVEFVEGQRNILVLGGSQGALGINRKLEQSFDSICAQTGVNLVWQAGVKNFESIRDSKSWPGHVHVKGFLEDVYAYLAFADVVISRAGASTLAELLAFGKPSILCPYPHATANHQEHNARVVENAGAALVELDHEPNKLWSKAMELCENKSGLLAMAQKAKSLGMPDAAERIAEHIIAEFKK